MAKKPLGICPRCLHKKDRCTCKAKQQPETKNIGSRLSGTRAWQRVSKAHLADFPLCASCFADGRVVAAEVVDHITPHRGNLDLFWDTDNLQSLCKSCHDKKTRQGL